MVFRLAAFIVLGALVFNTGCGKSGAPESGPPASVVPAASNTPVASAPEETVASFHWLGKKEIGSQSDAAGLMAIWRLPESVTLENQTLDKLSRAVSLLAGRQPDAAAAALLRPLLGDLVQSESYLEIRQATNHPGKVLVAIRLDDPSAAAWETNLASVVELLAGERPAPVPGSPHAWDLRPTNTTAAAVSYKRSGGWALVGITRGGVPALESFEKRIQGGAAGLGTNSWLSAELDPVKTVNALSLGWKCPNDLPKITLTVFGDGTNVRSEGRLDFGRPLNLDLEPWRVPTNIIDGWLVSFTAVRGVRPWLESMDVWTNLSGDSTPNQIFWWGQGGLNMLTYFAFPSPDASNTVSKISDAVLEGAGKWYETNDLARFERSSDFNGLDWRGLPYAVPFLESTQTDKGSFVIGGFFHDNVVEGLSPTLLDALQRTNLICYSWENTSNRIQHWIYLGQFIRFCAQKAQLQADSASMRWFKAISPMVHESLTQVMSAGPAEIEFSRRSTVGLTGLELQLLGDWLESPDFPNGLYTFRGAAAQQNSGPTAPK